MLTKSSKSRFVILSGGLAAAIAAVAMISAPPVSAQSASLSNISADTFSCMRRNNSGLGGYVNYTGENQGRILVFATGLGQVGELSFSFNANQQILNLAFVRGRAPFDQVYAGLNDTANKCRTGEYR